MRSTKTVKYGVTYVPPGINETQEHAILVSYNDEGNILDIEQFDEDNVEEFHGIMRRNALTGATRIKVEMLTPTESWSVRYLLIEDMTLVQLLWSDEMGYPERAETYDVTNVAHFKALANELREIMAQDRILI